MLNLPSFSGDFITIDVTFKEVLDHIYLLLVEIYSLNCVNSFYIMDGSLPGSPVPWDFSNKHAAIRL